MLHQGDWNSDDPAWEVVNGSLEQRPGGPWARIDRDANADLIHRGNVILDRPPNGWQRIAVSSSGKILYKREIWDRIEYRTVPLHEIRNSDHEFWK
jgi:hypothetical protein